MGGAWLPRPDMHGVGLWIEALRNQSCAALAHSSALRGPLRGAAIVFIAVAEEIAWRGGVQQHLSERLGSTRGWVVASILYALCQLGTGNVSVALVALPALAQAQGFPDRAVRVIVAFAPGGGTDIITRILARQDVGYRATGAHHDHLVGCQESFPVEYPVGAEFAVSHGYLK